MNREAAFTYVEEVIRNFLTEGKILTKEIYGNGHINDTFLIRYELPSGHGKKYILQRINTDVFRNPEELMDNILHVTSYLRSYIIKEGGDPERETLSVICTIEGRPYFKDANGYYWRLYNFIEDAVTYDIVKTPKDFYESALAFGRFQRLLADFPADTLHETIPGFHDTKARFERFLQVVKEDPLGRAKEVEAEIQFICGRRELAEILGAMQAVGELPLRVTHNDTKLNNVMLDKETGKAVCVIDLDTVMPGLSINDFGDSIRFGASTGAEDERDLSKVSCSMELFDIYVKGFVEGCAGRLTKKEMMSLPLGSKVMTYECGMRFLTDYLEGDTYFRIHREKHNLDRCRTQLTLVADMENKWEEMNQIVRKYL